jgi:CheY-like chemotaxis protein
MPLVGIIDEGSVERIIQSIAFARADVLILFARDQHFGHILFDQGVVSTARLDELKDEEALDSLKRWTSGHYTLIKRGHVEEGDRAHALLNGLDPKTRRILERWLKRQGYKTSVVGYPQHATQIISYLQPDLILTPCPLTALGASCQELVDRLRREMVLAPLVVAIDVPQGSCPEDRSSCIRITGTIEALESALSQQWPQTRLGVRLAVVEETAKIMRPQRPRVPPSEEVLAAMVRAPSLRSGRLGLKDLALPLGVLLLGSALIWLALWFLSR